MSDECSEINKLNSDITGVGVRVASYMQVILNFALSAFMHEAVANNTAITLFTSSSLLVAAIVQAGLKKMSRIDGTILFMLLLGPLFMPIGEIPSLYVYDIPKLGKKEKFKRRCFFTRATGLALWITFWILFYARLWLLVSTSIYIPEYFGVIFLTLLIGGAIFKLVDFWLVYRISQAIWNKGAHENMDPSAETSHDDSDIIQNNNSGRNENDLNDRTNRQGEDIGRAGFLKMIIPSARTLMKLFFGLLVTIEGGLIAMIEITVNSCPHNNESSAWTYGQITAFSAALLQMIITLCQFYLKRQAKKGRGQDSQGTNTSAQDRPAPATQESTETGAGIDPTVDIEMQARNTSVKPVAEHRSELEISTPRQMTQTNIRALTVPCGNPIGAVNRSLRRHTSPDFGVGSRRRTCSI